MKSIESLRILEQSEREHLSALPIYITLLIADADGTIDRAEMKKATLFSQGEASSINQDLADFYCDVKEDFEDKLKVVRANMPRRNEEKKQFLLDQIEKADLILRKIEKSRATTLCESFKKLARAVAKASGGIFGIGSVGIEETQLIDMHIINPL
ncbi:MAG: hypothetical protein KF860_09730 [Cyclobacteriaceae bacterium]|nr:hypothetical protein [Cyclobacteriaceae bacterium]